MVCKEGTLKFMVHCTTFLAIPPEINFLGCVIEVQLVNAYKSSLLCGPEDGTSGTSENFQTYSQGLRKLAIFLVSHGYSLRTCLQTINISIEN